MGGEKRDYLLRVSATHQKPKNSLIFHWPLYNFHWPCIRWLILITMKKKKKIRVYICFGFFGRPSILLSLFSNSLHFSRDFVRNESSIPWLFTDFDNIKDFPWLFNKFPDLEKMFFFLIFPWPREPCCYKNTADESEKRREKHQGIGRYLLLNIQNCSWQFAVNSSVID